MQRLKLLLDENIGLRVDEELMGRGVNDVGVIEVAKRGMKL
ncbi:MAG: hypothetical protein QW186_09645 [Candidatus Bathyarchaeia archaeon]